MDEHSTKKAPYFKPTRVKEKYAKERIDKYMPKDGFVHDFVNSLRGTEVPSSYALWSCYAMLSAMVKREAWLDWGLDRLFANLYVILVGPPGIVKKSTSILHATAIVRKAENAFEDTNMQNIKRLNIVSGKNSPEAIYEAVIPTGATYPIQNPDGTPRKDGDGNVIRYKSGSEIFIALSEMSSSMNKKQYAETFVENLLDLYDCVDSTDWRTVKRGVITLERTHTTLLAATTPRGFTDSLPSSVTGDGFLSRSILVYETDTQKEYHLPRLLEGAPDRDELAKRLAGVAIRALGRHYLTAEADEWYQEWYTWHRQDLRNRAERDREVLSRRPIHLLKVALLTKLQSYYRADSREITIDDLETAQSLMDYTYENTPQLFTRLEQTAYGEELDNVRTYIARHGEVSRRKLLQNLRIPAFNLDKYMQHLHQSGEIEIVRAGKIASGFRGDGKEVYRVPRVRRNTKERKEKEDISSVSEDEVEHMVNGALYENW